MAHGVGAQPVNPLAALGTCPWMHTMLLSSARGFTNIILHGVRALYIQARVMDAARTRSFILTYVDTSDVCRYIRLETYGDQIYPFLLLVLCAKLAKLAMGNSDQLNKHHHCIFPSFHLTRRQDLANARHQRGSRKGLATLVLTSTLQYYAEPFHCGDHSLAVCLALRLLN